MKEFILPDRGLEMALKQAKEANALLLPKGTPAEGVIHPNTNDDLWASSTQLNTLSNPLENQAGISWIRVLLFIVGGYLLYMGLKKALEEENCDL